MRDERLNYWANRRRLYVPRRALFKSGAATAVGAAGYLLVGCGDDDDDTGERAPDGNSSPSVAAGSPTAQAADPPNPEAAQPTGTLRVAHSGGSLPAFNPLTYTSGGQILYRDAIGDGLVNPGRNGDELELYGALAESYEKSPDGLTWTFRLNPNARFHNDTPVTSEDVKFTWEFMKTPEARHARKTEIAAALDNVETPDEQTAVFHLTEPYPQLDIRSNNWSIISSKLYQEIGADGYEANPIATGPFKFVSGTKDERVSLTAVEGHYRKTPFIRDYDIEIVPEEATRLARLQTGEADIIPISSASRQQAEAIDGARIVVAEGVVASWLAFMDPFLGLDTPTSDARVRKAMSMAVNRQGIVDGLLNGEAVLGGSFGLPFFNGYVDLPSDEYNLDEAKKMLDGAGFGDGFDIDFYATTPVAEYYTVIQADWKKIGINANLKQVDPPTWVDMINGHQTQGVYIQGTGADYIDPASYGLFIFSDGTFSFLQDFDAEADTLVNGADDNERFRAWEAIQQGVYDDTLYAALWYSNVLTAVGPSVKEWEPLPHNGYILLVEYLKL